MMAHAEAKEKAPAEVKEIKEVKEVKEVKEEKKAFLDYKRRPSDAIIQGIVTHCNETIVYHANGILKFFDSAYKNYKTVQFDLKNGIKTLLSLSDNELFVLTQENEFLIFTLHNHTLHNPKTPLQKQDFSHIAISPSRKTILLWHPSPLGLMIGHSFIGEFDFCDYNTKLFTLGEERRIIYIRSVKIDALQFLDDQHFVAINPSNIATFSIRNRQIGLQKQEELSKEEVRHFLAPLDRDRFLSGTSKGEIRIWNREELTCTNAFRIPHRSLLNFSIVRDRLGNNYVACSLFRSVLLYDLRTHHLVRHLYFNAQKDFIHLQQEGDTFFFGSSDSMGSLELPSLTHQNRPRIAPMAFLNNGLQCIGTDIKNQFIVLPSKRRIPCPTKVTAMTIFTPTLTRDKASLEKTILARFQNAPPTVIRCILEYLQTILIWADQQQRLHFFDLGEEKLWRESITYSAPICALAICHHFLMIGHRTNEFELKLPQEQKKVLHTSINVLDLEENSLSRLTTFTDPHLETHLTDVLCMAPLSDQRFVSGHHNGAIHIWNLFNRRHSAVLKLEDDAVPIRSIITSDFGDYIIAADERNRLHFWDIKQQKRRFVLYTPSYISALLSLSENILVIGCLDGALIIKHIGNTLKHIASLVAPAAVYSLGILSKTAISIACSDGGIYHLDTENDALQKIITAKTFPLHASEKSFVKEQDDVGSIQLMPIAPKTPTLSS